MLDGIDILKRFIPPHKQVEMQNRIVDILAKAFPDERWRKLIQTYRSDAAFRDALAMALKRAVQRFASDYEDKELVDAVTESPRFWDVPSVQNALQEIITRPSSYLQQERQVLFRSFADVLPTAEPERVEQAVRFFLRCLTEEVIHIPQLAQIYQILLQRATFDLQHNQNQLITALIEAVRQSQMQLAAPAGPTLPKLHDNLPPQHGEFLGREKDIQRVLAGLSSRWPLVSIEGLAGMGKTTLAIKIAHCCLAGPQVVLAPAFEYVVWVSAKDRPEQELWLNEVLDTTARVLGYPTITKMPQEQIEQKKVEVSQLLHNYRTLLIIDNFETIKDSALESWIQDIPEPSKVLITSRTGQLRSIRSISLKGLEEPSALELIRNYAQSLELQSIETAGEETLLPLVKVTGGNPQTIGMALGYIKFGRLSLHGVIENLHIASRTVNDVFDYLFAGIWNVMTREAQHVLLVTPLFVDYASKEALGAISGLTEYHLDNAVVELVKLKLLDIKEASVASSQHYSTHPLTRAFASARLHEVSEFEEQARTRWSKYYLDFAARHLVREQPKERYWNTLVIPSSTPIDSGWPNLEKVLAWTDQEGRDQILVELMLLLAHYMGQHFFHPQRLYYARKAAEAAERLGRKEEAALFHIDGIGWILIEEDRLEDARREIMLGLDIAETLDASSAETLDLIALANTFLARVFLEEENLAEASALIDKVLSLECRAVIQCRIDVVAGDIAYTKNNNAEAMRLYENAHRIGKQYGSEGEDIDLHYRLGNVNLASGDLVTADAYYNMALEIAHRYNTHETVYAKFGLARIAQIKGERDKARRLAQEALNDLLRAVTSHRLLNEIQDFLKSLEAD